MISKIEFHEEGHIKSIQFEIGAILSTVAAWVNFVHSWNTGKYADAIMWIESLGNNGRG